jgi:cytochrome c556
MTTVQDKAAQFAAERQAERENKAQGLAPKPNHPRTENASETGSSLVLRDSSVQALSRTLSAKKQQYQDDREQIKAQLRKVQTTLENAYGTLVDDCIAELEGEGIHFPKGSPLTLPDFSL